MSQSSEDYRFDVSAIYSSFRIRTSSSDSADEPGHDELCEREQAYFLKAIREDIDLSDHMADAVNSLRIVLAADRSIRERRMVELWGRSAGV